LFVPGFPVRIWGAEVVAGGGGGVGFAIREYFDTTKLRNFFLIISKYSAVEEKQKTAYL
jgi:hypothetical protein